MECAESENNLIWIQYFTCVKVFLHSTKDNRSPWRTFANLGTILFAYSFIQNSSEGSISALQMVVWLSAEKLNIPKAVEEYWPPVAVGEKGSVSGARTTTWTSVMVQALYVLEDQKIIQFLVWDWWRNSHSAPFHFEQRERMGVSQELQQSLHPKLAWPSLSIFPFQFHFASESFTEKLLLFWDFICGTT